MLQSRIKSFKDAIKGVLLASSSEFNFKIHLVAAILAVCLGLFFKITMMEWLIIILTIAMVLSAELINTAIEYLCDHIHPEKHPSIGKVKDVAAGAVLIAALGSIVIAIIIFGPHVGHLLMSSS